MKESESSPAPDSLRGFWSLFATQFQGAFSDNVLKNLVIFMLVAMDMSLAMKHRTGELVGALFSLPFILFSMSGGFLADRFSKRTITIAALIRLALLGFAGGLFIVPICALLQHRPDRSKKGEVLAAANLLSFVGVFLASGAHYLLAEMAHLSPSQIFLFSSILTLGGAAYVVILLPDSSPDLYAQLHTRAIWRSARRNSGS